MAPVLLAMTRSDAAGPRGRNGRHGPHGPELGPGAGAAGDEREAFWRELWKLESGPIHGFLRRRLGDADQADDLLQETFVRAIRAGRLEGGSPGARAYLFAIAQNLAADQRRRRLRLVAPPGTDGELEEVPDSASESPEASASRRGLERRVRAALEAMPERYRTAFRLAAIEQRSYREIAVATGWSLDQVRVNVHRARRRLIDELGSELVAEIRA